MTIDPRMAKRRRKVAEEDARRWIRRVIWLGVFLAVVAGVFALLNAPYFSVQEVVITGAERADVEKVLEIHQVKEGRPMVAIRPGPVQEALLEDPWVSDASVRLSLPNTIQIDIQERRALAWVSLPQGWGLLALDGVVVGHTDRDPLDNRPLIQKTVDDPGLGGQVVDDQILGSLIYLDALPDNYAVGSWVYIADEELWSVVDDVHIRLGSPIKMAEKAEAVVSVFNLREDGVIIDVIAPERPAIRDNLFDRPPTPS